ncbi:MAG: NAD(P)-dependent oxidoreductase [Planctomycetota bacterium]
MRVLIADKFDSSGIDRLKRVGCDVTSNPDLTPETLPAALGELDPDVMIVRSTRVPSAAIEAAGKLSLIVRAGAGYDNIDTAAASSRGIMVANCPGKNAIAVAELAWGLIVSADRRIPDQTIELRAGKWNKKEYGKSRGLYGRTLGIIGIGAIGSEVIARGRAFGMRIVAWSRSLTVEKADDLGIIYADSPIEVARQADVVSVHVALTPNTQHLCNAAFFDAMKDHAIFVNTSRGKVVDEAALAKAVESKNLRVGLDVWEHQPAAGDSESDIAIARVPHVYGTHHCGASTDQSQAAIAAEAARVVEVYKREGQPPNVVNLLAKTRATRMLTVRHMNRPGVLAHVIGLLGEAGINIEEMDNVIYEGGDAACARLSLGDEPAGDLVSKINDASKHVISVNLTVIDES